jgi:hypothetical protein
MLLPALEVDLVEGMRPDCRSCLVCVGRGNLGAEQTAFRQRLLSSARPQRSIRATLKPLAQARRLVEVK